MSSTPANNAWLSGNIFTLQQDFTELNLNQFIRTRSGTSYPIYDSGLVAMYNFDNIANLGESASSVRDISIQNKTGTATSTTWTGNAKWNGDFIFDGINSVITSDTRTLGGNATFSVRANVTNTADKMLWNHPSDQSSTYFDLIFYQGLVCMNA